MFTTTHPGRVTSMLCPSCGNPTTGVRHTDDTGGQIRRRRHCRTCRHLFWTVEQVEGYQDDTKKVMERLLAELPVALSGLINSIFSDS